jgi:glycerate kinase
MAPGGAKMPHPSDLILSYYREKIKNALTEMREQQRAGAAGSR